MLLALGLNVVVGWGGLLDLGYVAFYGFGAYAYAWVSSNQFTHAASTCRRIVAVPVVVAATAVLGLLVGLPSRRLTGDYLAIVTLFFGQIFTDARHERATASSATTSRTAPNGIADVDPFNLFGQLGPEPPVDRLRAATSTSRSGSCSSSCSCCTSSTSSRTGRAWRSLREDPLAAEMMGMPVNWLKLMAFAFGAAVAGFAGTIFAALNASVFPLNFSFPLLITVYAMVILGGTGSHDRRRSSAPCWSTSCSSCSVRGLGARPLLRAHRARARRHPAAVAAVRARLRRHGCARVRRLGDRARRQCDHDRAGPAGRRRLRACIAHWVVVPPHLSGDGKGFIYVALIVALLVLTLLKGRRRDALLVPTLYLAAFAWENVMALEARADPLHPARRDPRRDDGVPAGGPARQEAGGDRLMAEPLLELRKVSLAFGGLTVLQELDLHVDPGEIVSVIGPNGAGKTTLFNLVTGIYEPAAGDILFEGKSIVGLAPHRITRRGIARTFQTLRLFLNMTVKENVMAAAYGHTRAGPAALDPAHAGDAARGGARSTRSPRRSSRSSASG